ncbi:MAG: hypothetical protein K0R13_1602 [Propionibacteriaceae bacterium]|nr:hypothetical protein [Propionibacteriaceae bacterium]
MRLSAPAAGWCRVPGKPKDLETRAVTNSQVPPNSYPRFPGTRHQPASGIQALVTVVISHGLLGRPVPSALLPSWPSPAIDATTSREALSIVPKIVKFGV